MITKNKRIYHLVSYKIIKISISKFFSMYVYYHNFFTKIVFINSFYLLSYLSNK